MFLRNTFRYFYFWEGVRRMRGFARGESPDKYVRFIFDYAEGLFKPGQVFSEIIGLLQEVAALKPKVIVEIGTGRTGGLLFSYSRLSESSALIITVDMPHGNFGGAYPAYKQPMFKAMRCASQKIIPILADSHKQETLERIKKVLDGQAVDYLFLDGDHGYEGIKSDFDMYAPLVRRGGIIAFHDICVTADTNCQVDKFWNEIKKNYVHKEFIADKNQGWAGIGMLLK